MTNHSFSSIPSWISKPIHLQNVINNQLASLKDVSSFINLPDSSTFSSGLRQALFWKRRLSPSTSATTVIFSFLGPKGLILPNISEVFQALRNVCNILNITEIYRAYNSHFIGLSFNNPSDASKIRSAFTYYSDSMVIHVPISTPLVHQFKMLWLPPVFPDARIHHFLNKHSVHHTFSRDIISTASNTQYPTNSITGTLELSPKADVNCLPHLIPLPPPHLGHAFLIISGRSSFCLRCGQVGHVRRFCPAPKCSSCHKYHSLSSSCSLTDPYLDFSLDASSFDDHDSTSTSASEQHIPSLNDFTLSSSVPITTSANTDQCLNSTSLTPCITNLTSLDISSSSPKSVRFTSDLAINSTPVDPYMTPPGTTSKILPSSTISQDSSIFSNQNSCVIPSPDLHHYPSLPSTATLDHSVTASFNRFELLQDEADVPSSVLPLDPSSLALTTLDDSTPPADSSLVICTNSSNSSITDTHSIISNDHDMLDVSNLITSGSSTASSLSPTKKKHRSSSPNSELLSSTVHSDSTPSHLDWAEHVEAIFPLPTVSTSAELPHTSSPLPHDPYSTELFSLEQLVPHPSAKKSKCRITCSCCFDRFSLPWPINDIYSCVQCKSELTILHENLHIPRSSFLPVLLILSRKYCDDPNNISYLQLCFSNGVRLKTTHSKF